MADGRKENEKRFLRLLKELGILQLWKKERYKHVKTLPPGYKGSLFYTDVVCDNFMWSFVWADALYTNMWRNLSIFNCTVKEALGCSDTIKLMKEIVNQYI